ncbi:MAG: RNA polymerase sigma factor [Candidatus Aenigmatarchaeota archaeon]
MKNCHQPNQATDAELVRQTLQEPAIFSQIFNRYYSPLTRYIKRLGCYNNDDVQDILQETFISAYINLKDYDDNLKFSSWIYRIAHNKTISFFRKEKIRPRVAKTEGEILFMEMVADDVDPVSDIDKKDLQKKVRRALEKLDVKYRAPLILKFLEEKSYSEISDILRLPIGTVGTLINRGKQKFKDIFNKNNGE